MIGINLKALVLRTSKAGVELTMSFEKYGLVILRASRGVFTFCETIDPYGFGGMKSSEQMAVFEMAVDKLIFRLDKAEKTLIETGGTEK